MLPSHVGIIMDGNGRWAQERGLKRSEGYRAGLAALEGVLEKATERGIKAISVFAFSTENFARPEDEIAAICDTVKGFNLSYDGRLKITYMGDVDAFGEEFSHSVEEIEKRTSSNEGTILNIAFNYGARRDIVNAAHRCYIHGEFTEEAFEKNLSTGSLPPLDVILRSGREKRLSNFMLYEAAYAELVFIDKLWPDVTPEDFDDFLKEYEVRTRKFGA